MIDEISLHFVYVVDEKGKTKILAHLKQALVSFHHTTLIYFYSKDDFIFNRELDLLQKRYPVQFVINEVREKTSDITTLQELLKAVIDSNAKDGLIFILSADDEVVYNAAHTLLLSGIEEKQIRIHF